MGRGSDDFIEKTCNNIQRGLLYKIFHFGLRILNRRSLPIRERNLVGWNYMPVSMGLQPLFNITSYIATLDFIEKYGIFDCYQQ